MTKEEAQAIDSKHKLYEFFVVKGRGKDESKINLKFKKASQAFSCYENNVSHEATLTAIPFFGKKKILLSK